VRRVRAAPTAVVGALLVLAVVALGVAPTERASAASQIKGTGSSYVALAMQQWVADAQADGLNVNYLPTGSPQGLSQYADSLVDFAGTEAEYSALGVGDGVGRGFQYVPDVAGAVAIMYNAKDTAGRKVDSLHLSRKTVARIFIGDISRWNDPDIRADNNGLQLPDQPINVVYRGGQSGTTALFYDFVQHTIPDKFSAWASKNQLPTQVRIIQLDGTPQFAPKTQALNGSDQIAQFVASSGGLWSIAYDEFGYAVTYDATTSWVENQSGAYQLPYAENISAALESAKLRPDLSQDLSGVYTSANPDAYPISAYSYMVTQCAPTAERATCKGPYTNSGVADTLQQWMRYIACDGQTNMAEIGYSPLPTNLSQELVNSIGRMLGKPADTLTRENCANPRFGGSLGAGAAAPVDPYAGLADDALANGAPPPSGAGPGTSNGGGGSGGGTTGSGSGSGAGGGAGSGSSVGSSAGAGSVDGSALGAAAGSSAGVAGPAGVATAVGGGSIRTRAAAPVAYERPLPGSSALPVALLFLVLVVPLVLAGDGREKLRKVAKGEVGLPKS
jgi:phosphate transport system substrate-binding protein